MHNMEYMVVMKTLNKHRKERIIFDRFLFFRIDLGTFPL
jgi:hypothetical protein